MRAVAIRLGTGADGDAIGKLLFDHGFTLEGVDWSDCGSSFLVGEENGAVVACLQVCPSKPVGRLELLAVSDALEPLAKARLTGEMLEVGMNVLRLAGCQLVSGMVPFTMKHYRKVLKKRGAWIADTGHLLMGWLDDETHVMGGPR